MTEQLKLRIERDEYAEDPREFFDHLGTMVCWHKRYNLGDERPSCEPTEWLEDLPEGTIKLPLYLYDHGGITMSTGAFGDAWDSGQVGWIYAEPSDIRKEHTLGKDAAITKEIHDAVVSCLESEVKVYDQYLQGGVWCYTLERSDTCKCCKHTKWEHVDGCSGIFNGPDMLVHLKDLVPDEAHHLIEKAWEDRG